MFCFALMAVFTRGADAPILTISAWRALIVALVFGVWAFWVEGPSSLTPDKKTLRLGAWYGVALAVASSTFVGGYALTTVANTIFLHNLAPAVAFPLAWWLFKERPSGATIAGAAVALVGVGLLSGVSLFHFAHFTSPRFLLGDFLAVISAVGYAAVLVMTRLTRTENTPILGTLFVAWCVAAVGLMVITAIWGTLAISGAALMWVVALAVISTNVPFYLLNLGMKEISAGLAALLSMSELLFATLLGVLFYRESLAPIGWVGGVLVVIGVLYPFFEKGEQEGEHQPIAESTVPIRWARVVLGLVLLNAGAAVLLLSGDGVGGVLAWSGAVVLLRLGPSVLLGGAAQGAARWVLAGLALAALAGVLLRGGWQDPGLSALTVVAFFALLIDSALAGREAEPDRDRQPLLQLALCLVVVGQVVTAMGHPAGAWLVAGAAGALCLASWAVLASCFGASPSRYDGVVAFITPANRLGVAGVVLFFAGGVHSIPPGHQAVVERFGSPQTETLQSGLAVRLPPPIERIERVDVESVRRVQIIEPGTSLLCGDQSMISLGAVLHYSVSDPDGFAYGALDARALMKQAGRSALVASIGRQSQDSVLTSGRAGIEEEVAGNVQAMIDRLGFGIALSSVRLIDVSVPAPALASFLDVISADEERRTTINLAEAYAAKVIPEALGRAVSQHEAAEAYAYEKAKSAQVEDLRFQALVQGAKPGRSVTKTRLRFESLERSLSERGVVVAPETVRVWIGGQGPVLDGDQSGKGLSKERSQ